VATYLLSSSADFRIYLVNPRETEILGQAVYPSLQDLPEVPDLVDVFRKSDQPRSVMAVSRGLCAAYGALGDRARAEEAGREALELAAALSFDRVGVLVRLDLADAAITAGDLDGASAHLDDAADAAAGDVGRRPDLERRRALVSVLRHEANGLGLARRAVESASEQDNAIDCGLAWAVLAWAEAQAGEDDARQQASRHALRILREAGASAALAEARLMIAESCLELSRHPEAADHAHAALQFANEFARPPLHAWANRILDRAVGHERGSSVQRLTELATRIALQETDGDLLADLAAAAVDLMDADRAMVVLLDESGRLKPVARAGAHAWAAPSMTIVERVVETGREVVAADLGERGDLRHAASVVAMNLRAAVGLPLEVDGVVIGALYVDSRDAATGEFSLSLASLRALAAHASVALRQARLTDAIRRRTAAAERAWRYADDLLRAVPTPVVIAHPDGPAIDANRAAREWFPAEEEVHVDDRLVPLPGGFADEYLLRTDDGRVPVHVTRSEAVSPDGRSLTLFGFTDLTSRIEAEAQMAKAAESARESTAAKSRFLLSMSHELRTPLNAINGYAEMLMEDEAIDEMMREDLASVLQAADRLLGLIDNVLDISRIEAGRLSVELVTDDLAATVETAALRLRPVALECGVVLTHHCEGLGPWRTDHDRVGQILDHLVFNAVEHASASRITIEATRAADHARIEVRDDGTGIPEHRMETLFQPFQRLDPAERPGGAGLGLAIGYQLAQRLGGVLSVETAQGHGTCFTLVLPVA
ncbi:MAG: ATP-binding protein, partial [Myxococcota bacterium]